MEMLSGKLLLHGTSWFKDNAGYCVTSCPFFSRGGSYEAEYLLGLFYYGETAGKAGVQRNVSFRPVIIVLQ